MPDSVWYAKLRHYAVTGEWPTTWMGQTCNRPAPRQKIFFGIYDKVWSVSIYFVRVATDSRKLGVLKHNILREGSIFEYFTYLILGNLH